MVANRQAAGHKGSCQRHCQTPLKYILLGGVPRGAESVGLASTVEAPGFHGLLATNAMPQNT